MKRLLAILLACLMVLSMFSACGKKEEEEASVPEESEQEVEQEAEGEEEGEEEEPAGEDEEAAGDVIDHGIMSENGQVPIVEEKMEFDVNCRQVSNVPDMMTNNFVLWLEEQTNIHINYEMIPEDAIAEKTNLILASGEYPDGFQYSAINTTLQVKYGSQGAFVNLAPYYEKFGYYVNDAYANTTYLPMAIQAPDGAIYSVTGVNECYHCFHAGRAWINQEWMDALGFEYPNTTDELKKVLEGFRDNDCNGNGDASDEIPMTGCDAWNGQAQYFLLNSFLYCDYNMMIAIGEDQHIEYQAIKDEYREGLRMQKEWFDEGLLDPEYLSMTGSEMETLGMGESPRLGAFVAALWWSGVGNEQVEDDGVFRERKYVALSNVEGPEGVRLTLTSPEGLGGNFVITNACEYPEVLFRWCDFQMSEEASIRAYAGSYEVSISEPDEGALGVNKLPAVYKQVTDEVTTTSTESNDACDNVAISNRTIEIREGAQTDWDDPDAYYGLLPRLFLDTQNYYVPYDAEQYNVPTLVMDEADTNKRAEMETPIKDYQKEWLAKFIVGDADLDNDWDTYVEGFDGLRLEEYISLLDTYYQNAYVQ